MTEREAVDYHERQFKIPYRSTVAFEEFLASRTGLEGVRVLDLACGGGANEYYFGKKYPSSQWCGMDINQDMFSLFEKFGEGLSDVRLEKGDWYNINEEYRGEFDGVISLQSLSWLPEWKQPMDEICKLNPKWIALSSLFYEGDIEYFIKLTNYERPAKSAEYSQCYYNIYSLPRIEKFLKMRGYSLSYEPFEIDIDIPKPDSKDIGTYTLRKADGRRVQISAALMLPWYFLFAER